ncbi:MAG: hypothetical protein M9939_00440 [Mesorhizobium sp.]|nr:hypothetical protein [Mesorhizobium sp.]MCO5159575.1 hypothetical protein [Mesorhizobium sp.]
MKTFGRLSLAALMSAGACGGALSQDVGTIQAEGLYAWVDKMPPPPDGIHLRGTITAPTPCHETATSYEGDSKSNPPIYRVKVSIVEPSPDLTCVQVIADIPFAYDEANYVGNHEQMEVFSDNDSKTVKIEVVQ